MQATEQSPPLLAEYLDPSELARELNTSRRTIDRWSAMGVGPAKTKIGRQTYYRRRDVERWLAEQAEQPKKRRR